MLIYLLRHGQTAYNAERRYQGVLDIPLSDEGFARLTRADFDPPTVYTSTLRRTAQTARALFPSARLVPVADLREMDFGAFQGRTASEMEHDDAYRTWVDGGCTGCCPGGESQAGFSDRVCQAFARLVDQALDEGEDRLTIVAHGGTQMAALERFAEPARPYYAWCAGNASGYVFNADRWRSHGLLDLVREVSYVAEDQDPEAKKPSFWEELSGVEAAGEAAAQQAASEGMVPAVRPGATLPTRGFSAAKPQAAARVASAGELDPEVAR